MFEVFSEDIYGANPVLNDWNVWNNWNYWNHCSSDIELLKV